MIDWVLTAPGKLERHSFPTLKRPPGRGEVVVEVDRLSLCGSDYRLFGGDYAAPRSYPLRFGHEWAGRIIEVGAGSRFSPGNLVTGDCSRWCGDCDLCDIDRNLCRRIEKFGITCDGFSSRRRVVEERYLYRDERNLGPELLALVELFAVALRGVEAAELPAEGVVEPLVIGAGCVGLAVGLILLGQYGSRPCLLEVDPDRVAELTRRFPEMCFRQAPPQSEAGSYCELLAGHHPWIFECSGAFAGIASALRLAAPRGRVIALGLTPVSPIEISQVVTKRLTLVGSIGGTGAFPAAMEFLAAHREIASRFLTHRFPAESAPLAFALPAQQRVKVQLDLSTEG